MGVEVEKIVLEVTINGKKAGTTLKDLGSASRVLNKQLRELTPGSDAFIKKSKELQKVKARMKEVRGEIQGTGNALQQMQKALGPIGSMIAGAFTIGAIVGAGRAVFNFQQELQKTRREVRKLTGETGEMLDSLTARIQATADTFDKDFNEVLIASNSLAKQMGISHENAIDVIQKGFIAGADSSGEFLDMLKEYPVQLEAVGLSAEASIALMTQQVTEGIYSDKGIDTIKEAGLRLREMTPATKEALDLIGLSSDKIQQSLEDGTKTLFDVIQDVSKQLDTLPPQSAVVGTAIADIFGGAGEDAGLQYIKTLSGIELGLDNIIDRSSEFVRLQMESLKATELLNEAINNAAGGTEGMFDGFMIRVKTFATDIINVFSLIGRNIKAIFTGDFEAMAELKKEAENFTPAFVKLQRSMIDLSKVTTEQLKKISTESANAGLVEVVNAEIKKREEIIKTAEAAKKAAANEEAAEATKKRTAEQIKADEKAKEAAIKAQQKFNEETKKLLDELQNAKIANIEDIEQREITALEAKFERKKGEIEKTKTEKLAQDALIIELETKLLQDIDEVNKKFREEKRQEELEELQIAYELKTTKLLEQFEEGLGINEELEQLKLDQETEFLINRMELELQALELSEDEKELIRQKHREEIDKKEEEFARSSIKRTKDKAKEELKMMMTLAKTVASVLTASLNAQIARDQQELISYQNEMEGKKEALKRQLDAGEISKRQYDNAILALDEAYDKEVGKVKKEQFEKEKEIQLTQAWIHLAQSVLVSLASTTWPLSLVLAAGAAIVGGIQIDQIKKQKFPGYAGGGETPGKASLAWFGEEGPEYVSPNWMYESPMYADTFAMLEHARRNKIGRYQEGGPTDTQATPAQTITDVDTEQIEQPGASQEKLIEVLEKIETRLGQPIRAFFTPDEIEDINDFNEELDQIKGDANIG